MDIDQRAQGVGEVDGGAAGGDDDLAPAQVRGTEQEEVGPAVASILGVRLDEITRGQGLGWPGVARRLLAGLVETVQGLGRIDWAGIDGRHLLHGDKVGIVVRRNNPPTHAPGLERVALSAWPNV